MSSFDRNKGRIKERLSEAQNHRCPYCGIVMKLENPTGNDPLGATINMVIPKTHGGTTDSDNLFVCCLACTKHRADMNAMEYWAFIHSSEFLPREIIASIHKSRKRKVKRKRWRSDPKLRIKLSEAQNHRCCYCGFDLQLHTPEAHDYATIEHVIERGQGGSDKSDNLVVCCTVCNGHRNDTKRSAVEYWWWVIIHGRWSTDIHRYSPPWLRKVLLSNTA